MDIPTHTAVVSVSENGDVEISIWYDPGGQHPVTKISHFRGHVGNDKILNDPDHLLSAHGWLRTQEWRDTHPTRTAIVRPCPA